MRYGSGARRTRNSSNSHNRGGNGNQRRGIQNKNKVFDSNGPDVRIRGTAYQIVEKYMALAKDTNSAGDRVLAENYLQYAEHYQRIINSWEEEDANFDAYNNSTYDRYSRNTSQADDEADENNKPEEDLGLPSSILGKAPEKTVSSKSSEMADA
ncbi:MAG TPA: DUF4167 domain-containing protein [Alphaproteobacteria bacterium]|nr:DUF4167 domain-containing protein [Alphaproteobacteria bacterium]